VGGSNATREDVARLLGRVAFGATSADLDAWSHAPYEALVDHLLAVPMPDGRKPAVDDAKRITLERNQNGLSDMQSWWLERMRTTPYPLEERLTLLWHDHFATAARPPDVNANLVFKQIQTLRRNALGNFRNLLIDVCTDPAMLLWLNGVESTGSRPNENFAREFFELFSLGTHPQAYTESDVRQAARVFTGWTVDASSGRSAFDPSRHDAGAKQVLGTTITNGGATEFVHLVDVALAQRVAARFIAYKLVAGLAYAPATTDLLSAPDPLVAKVATALTASKWELKPALRTLMLADEFRTTNGADARRAVRSPAEVAVSTCKALKIAADDAAFPPAVAGMGQQLLVPPNVGGWPKGKRWLSSSTVVGRYSWGITAYASWQKASAHTRAGLPAPADLAGWASRFGVASVSPSTADAISTYVSGRKGAGLDELQAGVMALVLTSPDWTVV
jgi:uncharacterized protein (DUF1800 family)